MKRISLLIILIVLIFATGCTFHLNDREINLTDDGGLIIGEDIDTGDIKTFGESFDGNGLESAKVMIDINSANIRISKNEEDLFRGEVKTNVKGIEPIFKLDEDKIIIKDTFNYKGINKIYNKWDLRFSDKLPLNFDININAVKNEFDLTDLMVKDFSINTNASNTIIRTNNKNKEILENLDIEMNAGNLEIRELGNMNVENIGIEMNAGKLDLDFGEKIYRDTSIEFDGNVSEVDIKIPDNVGIKISNIDSLSNIKVKDNKLKSKDGDFKTSNYESSPNRVIINLKGTLLNMEIK
ncbi:hypothetical protein GOQ27_13770 [Clostridium sp. D2Q-11]|uniref:DUF2154 domain-containing protein n=1 Tax=Anaeromonas frigoriresistens TaxID=2683708 RepID=A0A942UZ90_9FIRM|nr:toast rack family protein [Anaeromonas frigoriresistens]MBS4539539.1 hypothetical protein [Anaeromonas frigoriresistens]